MGGRNHSSLGRPHWLCVAYAFPPINRSGTHRTLAFVKHLDERGWDATVLTVEPRNEPLDESLLREVPASATVLRTPWFDTIEHAKRIDDCRLAIVDWALRARKSGHGHSQSSILNQQSTIAKRQSAGRIREWVSRLLVTPDSRIGWIYPAVRVGLRAIRLRRPDVLYSTSPYMSAHLVALILSRLAYLPWVADFRDPWRGNPFCRLHSSRGREPAGTFASLDRWDALIEWMVLRSAANIVCCTPTMTEALCHRRPFVSKKCTTILNGFDRQQFDNVEPMRFAPDDHFVLTHCGQFYGPRSPRVWFAALRSVLDRSPEFAGRIHLQLIGSESYDGRSLSDWAAQAGVGECVRVLGQKSHAEALSYMAGSDALLLAGSTGTGAELQVPNKLFEYLALRKPIIAACSAASPIVKIISDARAEAVVCDPDDEQGLAGAITRLAVDRHVNVENAWAGVSQFDRAHRANELAEVFRRVAPHVKMSNGECTRPHTMNILPPRSISRSTFALHPTVLSHP